MRNQTLLLNGRRSKEFVAYFILPYLVRETSQGRRVHSGRGPLKEDEISIGQRQRQGCFEWEESEGRRPWSSYDLLIGFCGFPMAQRGSSGMSSACPYITTFVMFWSWQCLPWTETQAMNLKVIIHKEGKSPVKPMAFIFPRLSVPLASYQRPARPRSKSIPSRKLLQVSPQHNPVLCSLVEYSTPHNFCDLCTCLSPSQDHRALRRHFYTFTYSPLHKMFVESKFDRTSSMQ